MKHLIKKSVSIVTAVAILMSGMMYSPMKEKEVKAESEETENPIEISTVDELWGIRNDLDADYILVNDIDLTEATAEGGELDTGHGWTPIDEFTGTLDGNGHQIKGLTMYGDVGDYVGLFGKVTDNGYSSYGNIKNLGLTDVNIDVSNARSVGAILGASRGETLLCGWRILNCFVTGTIKASGKTWINCGGIIGGSYSEQVGTVITDCYNAADIEATVEEEGGTISAGGISGNGEIFNSYNRCYNVGNINNGSGGGIIGYDASSYQEEIITDCFYLKGTGVEMEGYGEVLTAAQMKKAPYFTNFDFNDIWEIDECYTYKQPQLKSCMQGCVESISIEELPTKLEYEQGEKLDLSGSTLRISYKDGYQTTTEITEKMLGEYDMTQIGEQEIIVTKGGAVETFGIEVKEIPVRSISVSKSKVELAPGDWAYLTANILPANATNKEVVWSSSKTSVATVTKAGKVTAISEGEATIAVKAQNGVSATCKVVVEKEEIEVTPQPTSQPTPSPTAPSITEPSITQPVVTPAPNVTSSPNVTEQSTPNFDFAEAEDYEDWEEEEEEEVAPPAKVKIKKLVKKGKKVTINWKKVKEAKGYQIQVATNRKFTKGKKTYKVGKKVIKKNIKLAKKKTYYIRIRAFVYDEYSDTIYGKYSSVKKIRM